MDDPIEVALRRKKDSSMRVAINQVKPDADGASPAQACVSAGNTGALMAVSRYVLKTLDGIDRPAIATVMPNERDGYTTVLDLGANVDCTRRAPAAVRGDGQRAGRGRRRQGRARRVGLLNIGEEAIKGSETIKQAGELLRAAAAAGMLNFYGNVEGNDIFKGTTDIVVCDGFVGNVALKTAEGLATMLVELHQAGVHAQLVDQAGGAGRAAGAQRASSTASTTRRYNGAALLGLRGLVFKSHGSADAFAFEQALNRAYDAARNGLLDRVHDRIRATRWRRCRQPRCERRRATPRCAPTLARNPHDHRRAAAIRASPAPAATCRRSRVTQRRSWPRSSRRDGIETSDEWIVERTGIRARHFAEPDVHLQRPRASRRRGARSRPPTATPQAIDLIIVATSTPDMVFPSAACIVQHKLGIHGCAAFDVQAVCSGFVYALTVADAMIKTGGATQGAGDRRRSVLAHPRFQRPHHLRAVRRRRRRGRARGERRRPASWRASCTPTAATSTSCACRAPSPAARCSAIRC